MWNKRITKGERKPKALYWLNPTPKICIQTNQPVVCGLCYFKLASFTLSSLCYFFYPHLFTTISLNYDGLTERPNNTFIFPKIWNNFFSFSVKKCKFYTPLSNTKYINVWFIDCACLPVRPSYHSLNPFNFKTSALFS